MPWQINGRGGMPVPSWTEIWHILADLPGFFLRDTPARCSSCAGNRVTATDEVRLSRGHESLACQP
jgi:hypothetical protein